ncbi:hypothetical protein [Streptomyces fagopyri]|uniref:hypothetical protein n=1 Tax=Streptomyces fagopyri TaxID=2662397 RepID=UPI003721ED9B
MNVDDVVREQIDRARRRAEEQRRQRAELAAARRRGLGFRHSQRLRNLAASPYFNGSLAASGA